MTSGGTRDRLYWCRLCGRGRGQVRRLVSAGEISVCDDCVELGLQVARYGEDRIGGHVGELTRLRTGDDTACHACERNFRYNFWGMHRPLVRVAGTDSGAVVCVECLDHFGDVINGRASR